MAARSWHEEQPSLVKDRSHLAGELALHALAGIHSGPGKPWLRSPLPSSEDGVECRYFRDFTCRERMYSVDMTLAGAKQRKTIRRKKHVYIVFIQHARRNLMLKDPCKPGWWSILLNQLGKVGFSS